MVASIAREDAPRRMLISAPAPDGGIAPAPGAAAAALAPQGAVQRHHHNASRTNSSSSSSDTSSSDASGLSPELGSTLRMGLIFALAASFFAFACITLTPNYVFCPTFPPLLLLLSSSVPSNAPV